MKYKLFISAAGKGGRVSGLAAQFGFPLINKSLLPINYEAVISKIIDKYPKNLEIIIALGHQKELVKNFIKIRHSDRKIKFVIINKYFGKGSGPGFTLYQCRKYLQCPFIYSACDTIVTENIPLPKNNWLGVAKVKDPERFLVIEKKKSDNLNFLYDKKRKIEIDEKKTDFNAFIGLAGIYDYKNFWQGFLNNKQLVSNELQVSNGLNYILSNAKIKKFTWFDTGTDESYLNTLKYFKDNTLRKPNTCVYLSKQKVIKYFSDKKTVTKLKKRSNYLNKFSPRSVKSKLNFLHYDYAEGRLLSDLSMKDFKYLIIEMNKKFWDLKKNINIKNFKKKCFNFYKNKTFSRVNLLLNKGVVYDDIPIINNVKVNKIFNLLNKVDWLRLSQGTPSNFHGDFQPENIIIRKKNITLIDWREDFDGNKKFGDIYYDFAKLDHALFVNGEIIRQKKYSVKINKKNIKYSIKTRKKLLDFQNYFHEYLLKNKFDLYKVKLLSSLIYLNIAALHDYPYNEFLFYHGKYKLSKLLRTKWQ
jgi:dTDP-glucose pyrophosphorylase